MNHKPHLYIGWNPCCLRLNALMRLNRFGMCNQGYRRAWETNDGLNATGSRLPLYVSASHGDSKLKLLSIQKARLHTGMEHYVHTISPTSAIEVLESLAGDDSDLHCATMLLYTISYK